MIGDLIGSSYLCTMPIIEIQHISKKYGKNQIFENLNAVFESGIYGISGPNGSGKSTLMKCLSGLLRPDSGHVHWKLKDRSLENKDLYQYLGFSAPYIQHYNDLSCRENLQLILELLGRDVQKGTVNEVLDEAGLSNKADEWYGNLSSGQQQRLKLAGALVKKPDFLLLDEPGTNLDKKGYELVKRIAGYYKNAGKMVVIASNDPVEIELCEHVIHLET